jgi:ABC-type uncharacterized transport system substrate-binding protein
VIVNSSQSTVLTRRGFARYFLLAFLPISAWAQPQAKSRKIAVALPSEVIGPGFLGFIDELRKAGFVEGQNLTVLRFSAGGRADRFPEIAHQVVGLNPDLIYAVSSRLVGAMKAETKTIPIIGYMADPVFFGLVESLSHPGGNVTGVSSDAGLELIGKQVELLREVFPGILKLGFLAPQSDLGKHLWKADCWYCAIHEDCGRWRTILSR